MTGPNDKRAWKLWLAACSLLCLLASPVFAANLSVNEKKQQARSQFEIAERMREELNGLPQHERSRREYQRVMDAYRHVYYSAPSSSKADASVVAVAELLAESGRSFNDDKALRAAISQYEFLRREYPGSRYRFDALFTIGQIYKDDLDESDKARETFQELIHRYPHLQLAADARDALAEMDQQARSKPKPPRTPDARTSDARTSEAKPPEARSQESKLVEAAADAPRSTLPLVTGIRHWSTPDYTRVAIDLEQEVKYEAGRVPKPDRIFFDLHDTKLASTLVGKTFEVSDGFLRRVRVAQFQKGMVRVVLEVDDVSDYSAFLLPNPYRLIIDIHGRKPNAPQTMVARAQQEGEKRVPSPAQEAKPEKEAKPETSPPAAPPPFRADQAQPVQLPGQPHPGRRPRSPPRLPSLPPASSWGLRWQMAASSSHHSAEASTAAESAQSPAHASASAQESTQSEVANLNGPELKATDKPTSEPTVQVVAPRGPDKPAAAANKKNPHYPEIRQAQPTADGQRSLIRALGLKVGRIVIDAGHGGHDTGTIGPNGLLEKDLVLDVSLRLGQLAAGENGGRRDLHPRRRYLRPAGNPHRHRQPAAGRPVHLHPRQLQPGCLGARRRDLLSQLQSLARRAGSRRPGKCRQRKVGARTRRPGEEDRAEGKGRGVARVRRRRAALALPGLGRQGDSTCATAG